MRLNPREGCYIIHTGSGERSGCVLPRVLTGFLPEQKSNGALMGIPDKKTLMFWFALESRTTRFVPAVSHKSRATHQRFDASIRVQWLFAVQDERSQDGDRGGPSISQPVDKETSQGASSQP